MVLNLYSRELTIHGACRSSDGPAQLLAEMGLPAGSELRGTACRAEDAAAWVGRNLAGTLRAGGVLVTGQAERPPTELGLERLAASLYRKGAAA